MKKIILFSLLLALLGISCQEIPPNVLRMGGPVVVDPTIDLKDQKRQVLMEEFTGVNCIQCPEGSKAIEGLLETHGNRLVVVSIHPFNDLTVPHFDSEYDFRTEDGNDLMNHIGIPVGFPTASINRKLFTGEDDLQLALTGWAGSVELELLEEPRVKIGVESIFGTNRNLDINVTLLVEDAILAEEDPRITIMITESNIKDDQLTPESSPGTDGDYIHNHALREILTNFDGDSITENLIADSQIELDYNYTLPAAWKVEECEIVVFIHGNGAVKEVYQAIQVHVVK